MMDPLTLGFWQHLGMAVLCGAILGVEREINDKPAGLRTCILVCVGSMLFIRLGLLLDDKTADPTRVLSQIVTGVGFIGAGVILSRGAEVKGVTTAAVIWLLAAIGAMIGLDQHAAAMAVSLTALIVLVGLEQVAQRTLDKDDDEIPIH